MSGEETFSSSKQRLINTPREYSMVPMAPSATMARRASWSRNSSARVVLAVGMIRIFRSAVTGAAGPDDMILPHMRRYLQPHQSSRLFCVRRTLPGVILFERTLYAASADHPYFPGDPSRPGGGANRGPDHGAGGRKPGSRTGHAPGVHLQPEGACALPSHQWQAGARGETGIPGDPHALRVGEEVDTLRGQGGAQRRL